MYINANKKRFQYHVIIKYLLSKLVVFVFTKIKIVDAQFTSEPYPKDLTSFDVVYCDLVNPIQPDTGFSFHLIVNTPEIKNILLLRFSKIPFIIILKIY